VNPRSEFGGVVCAPISGNFRAFKAALIAADRQVGRPPLPGCCYSAVSLGMWIVAHAKSLQTNTREVARLVGEGCLGAADLWNEMIEAAIACAYEEGWDAILKDPR
jgi:hypothetical protein